ncbi:TPM domain-containing protein [Streptococcus sp. X16XC17]|uniref:TPM domain-containing protein n=1 Tax=unclassified Streptococcus TaxID=2608887 RepID=UPI00069D7040|nr:MULTISPECIES: TPM domain-containing protein [unclassified Streptococcus]TCD46480.1 TPM domain-containing protein [Streptococcus sp. X16XC17]
MKKFLVSILMLVLVGLGIGLSGPQVQAQLPNQPIDTTVVDDGSYLSSQTIATIDKENKSWSQTDQQLQVGVYITDRLPSSLETFSNELFRKWMVGYSGTNNGTLLVIAIKDRQFRIETSDRASTVLTDVTVKRILDSSRDFFRAEDYDNGVLYIIDAMADEFYGTNRAQTRLAEFEENQGSSFDIGEIIFAIVFVLWLIIVTLGKGGGRGGGSGTLLWILANSFSGYSSGSSRNSSSSSFGSSGGGGWSGGGGDGGGASSGW